MHGKYSHIYKNIYKDGYVCIHSCTCTYMYIYKDTNKFTYIQICLNREPRLNTFVNLYARLIQSYAYIQ
jgi:hypothetical protein